MEYFDFIVDILEKPEDFRLERDFLKFVFLNENQPITIKVLNILTNKV